MKQTKKISTFPSSSFYLFLSTVASIFKKRIGISIFLSFFILFVNYTQSFASIITAQPQAPIDQRDRFQTNLFTGSAEYSYPIKVPQGTNNVTPEVSLDYDSSSTHGTLSKFGDGWELNQDYIQRNVNYTPSDTSDDKYILHLKGQTYDLVYNSTDSLFHTKIESHLKIQQFLNGGQGSTGIYWQVTTTDGTVFRFGYLANAELLCGGQSYDGYWNVDQVTDTYGNNISYTYTSNNGVSYLSTITYNNDQTREIDFNYLSNPYQRQLYVQGCLTTETQRLNTIQIKIGTNLIHEYDLAYTTAGNNQSLLQSITEKGADGSSLPPTTFDYKPEIKTWPSTYTLWARDAFNPNFSDPNVLLLDVNGDGLPDVVSATNSSGTNDSYYVYKNTGNSWTNSGETWINNINMDALPSKYWTRFMDMNGDGLPDIVKATSDTWYVWLNTGSSWNPTPQTWATSSTVPGFLQTNNHVALADVNGDGLPDVVQTNVVSGPNTTILVWKNNGTSFNTTPETWVNNANMDVRFDETNIQLTDVNGDGLPDFVKSINNGGPNNEWDVWLNTGHSWNTQMQTWDNPIDANLDSPETGLIDVNGDGLPDIVRSVNLGGPNNEWRVFLNNGNGWASSYTDWVNPIDSNIDNQNEARMADVNGDGLTDILRVVNIAPATNEWRVWANNGYAPDLLSTIHNSSGGSTSFEYTPSTHYSNLGNDSLPDLPYPLWVVSKMTVDNGMTNSQHTSDITTYSYKNGLYNKQNKEFRGFGEVDETDPNGSKKQSFFDQDDALKGQMYKQLVTDSSGNPYTETDDTWSSAISNSIYTDTLTSEKKYTYDGSANNPKITETDYQYDQYGNVTKESDLGDTSISSDDRFVYNEYTYNTTAWIVDTLKHTYLNASDDTTKVSEIWDYYDNNTDFNTAPTKGDITKEVKWLDTTGGTNPITQYAYDTYGNQTSMTDANNHTTTTVYDSSTHTYPVSITNAKNQTTTVNYDLGTGNLLSKTDPNGLTTNYLYDVFGRVTKEIKPYDSSTYPTTFYQYFADGIAPEGVLISKRTVSSSSATLDTYTWVDGVGRTVQTRVPAEDTTKQIVTDTFYDPTGEIAKQTVPHLDTLATTYVTPVAGVSNTQTSYDPVGRVTIETNPDGTFKTTTYDHWKETIVDENGHIKRNYFNAFDKIVKVDEVQNGLSYSTTYAYNPRDQLSSITDTSGNTTSFAYDSLGRKTSQIDPDRGTWTYTYDGAGNLLTQKDARNITTTRTYDALDRLTKTDYPTDTDTTYAYDIGKIGTVSIATDSAGTVSYTYDNRLRKTQEQRLVNGTTKTTQFSYDASDRMTTQTNPDGEVVTYAYNPQGEIHSVSGTTGIVNNIDYNAQGKITKKDFANGLSTNYTYNTTDFRLNRIQTGTLQDLNYTYDTVGNVKTITDAVANKTQTFGYDDLDRLTTASESGGFNYQYDYNPIGNLTRFTDKTTNNSIDYTYGQNAGPHALSIASSSAQQATSSATEILGTTWTLAGNNGSAEQDEAIASDTISGATSVQVTFNLHGTSFGNGDDEASVVFIQNGDWRAANVIVNGGQNGLNGSQTVTIPIGNFHKVGDASVVLDPNQPVTNLHARFWNSGSFSVDITSVKVVTTSGGGGALTNLALNKPTTTSSVESNDPSLAGSGAVDGNTSTRWSSNFSDPQWIYVDLGASYRINRVKLVWETAYGSAYQIQTSNDAVNWTTIYSTSSGDGGTDDLTSLSGTGRYVRMYGTSRGTIWGYSLYEFEVYGQRATTVPLTVSVANLTTGSDTDGNSTASTASVTPAAGKLELLTVSSKTNNTTNPNKPTVTGNGLTWVAVGSTVYDITSTSRRRVTLFRATGTSPTSGAASISFGGQNQTDVAWVRDEATNVDTSGISTVANYPESNASGANDAAQSTSNPGAGQIFTPSQNTTLDSAQFYLSKVGSPTGTGVIKIYAISGTPGTNAVPTGTALATSDAFDVSTLSGSPQMTTLHFSGANRIALTSGTWYAITFEYTNGDTANYVSIGADDTAPTHAGNEFYYDSGWVADATWDEIFSVFGATAGIVQSAAGNAQAATGLSVSLSSFANTANATYGAFGNDDGDGTGAKPFTAGSGFTLATQTGTTGVRAGTEFKSSNDTSVDVTQGTDDVGGIAVELQAGTTTLLEPPSGAGPYTYDADGNMLSDGLNCYHYNEANQLDKVTNCNTSLTVAEYVYDYNGNRMVKRNFANGVQTNAVISWSDSYETVTTPGGTQTSSTTYYFANGQLLAKKNPDGSKYYIHSDHLGSTSVVTDQSGALVEATSYDPWGAIKSGGTKSKFLYTGQEKDSETNLNYYNARYYDSHIRRFTQPDDVVADVYNPQTLNVYSYVQNNPLRYTDPTGHINEILAYNNALTNYYTHPSAKTYNNVLTVTSSIQGLAKSTGSSGSSGGGNSGGSSIAAAAAGNITQYRIAGNLYETQSLAANGYEKNTSIVRGYGSKNIIPDIDARVVGDAKRVQYLAKTRQMEALLEYAQKTQRMCVIICPVETQLSGPMQKGLEDLGEEGKAWKIIRYGSLKAAPSVSSDAFLPMDFLYNGIVDPHSTINTSGTVNQQ